MRLHSPWALDEHNTKSGARTVISTWLIVTMAIVAGCSGGSSESTTTDPSALTPPPAPDLTSTTNSPPPELSDGARDWCRFTGSTDEDADRFDLIFEAGLSLELNMDVVNAAAAGLRTEYESQGMSPDESVQAVSDDLLEYDSFVAACRLAFELHGDE